MTGRLRIVARTAAFLAVVLLWRAPAAADCRYDVTPDISAGLARLALDVVVDCDAALRSDDFELGYSGREFVEWSQAGGLSYRVRLGEMAGRRSPSDFAATGRGVLAPLAAWLAAPASPVAAGRLEIAFRTGSGIYPLTNLARDGDRRVLLRSDWRFGGYSVFADRRPLMATAPGPGAFAEPGRVGPEAAEIRIAVLGEDFALTDADFVAWIERFSGLVARFWAGFPSDRLLVAVAPGGRPRDPFGRVRGGGGATMMLRLAETENPAFLHREDWVLTHELIHLGAPFAPRTRPWFMEGMATYLEPLIRALGGATTREAVWTEWVRAMPLGARGIAAGGLEGPGRVYWTGALYFLLAHLEMARRGDPQAMARCFRAMRGKLGDASSRTTVDALIAACDNSVGAPILADLRRRYSDAAAIDLPELWRQLGVERAGAGLAFSEYGAGIRAAIFDRALFPPPTH